MKRALRAALAVVLFLVVGVATVQAFPKETPGLLESTLLNGVIVSPTTGAFTLNMVQALNLPEPPGGTYEATSTDAATQLWAILATADGTQIARLNFTTEKIKPALWLLSYYTVTLPDGTPTGDEPKLSAGDYLLEFHLPTDVFYRYPFSVKQVGDRLLTMGDWNAWAYFFYADADPKQPLVWKVWLRREETGNRDGVESRVEIAREKDGKVVATSRPNSGQNLNDKWIRYEFDLIHPMQGTSGGAFMTASDLLAQPGKYQLRMSMSGAPYGVWKFEIADGKLVVVGRADRETAEPLTYVCGGTDAFWYQSEAAVKADASRMAKPERTFTQKGFIPDCDPISVGGVTLVLLKPVATFLEATTTWEAPGKVMVVKHDEHLLRLTVGKATAEADGKPLALGTAPVVRDGQLYVALRPMAIALGAEMEWDAAKKLAIIIDGDRAGMIHIP